MINKINPAKIIPVHTTDTGQFESMFEGKIVLPKYTQPIVI